MEQWTLRRKALAEASDADKPLLASELELWLAEQPQWFREAEANSRLLGDLQALEQLPQPGVTPHCANSWDRRRQTGAAPAGREPAGVRAAAGRLSGRDQAPACRGPGQPAAGDPGTLVRARSVATGGGPHPAHPGRAVTGMKKGARKWAPFFDAAALTAACWHPAAAAR